MSILFDSNRTSRYLSGIYAFFRWCVDKFVGRIEWRHPTISSLCQALRLLRAYVCYATHLCTRHCAPTRQAPQQTLKTDIGIEARGDIIAYRRSGLVQRRALLRVGRRIAPCLLVCGRLRYVPRSPSLRFRQRHRRGTCQSLLCYAPRLPPHRQTLRNTAMPTLRTARAFCAYS